MLRFFSLDRLVRGTLPPEIQRTVASSVAHGVQSLVGGIDRHGQALMRITADAASATFAVAPQAGLAVAVGLTLHDLSQGIDRRLRVDPQQPLDAQNLRQLTQAMLVTLLCLAAQWRAAAGPLPHQVLTGYLLMIQALCERLSGAQDGAPLPNWQPPADDPA